MQRGMLEPTAPSTPPAAGAEAAGAIAGGGALESTDPPRPTGAIPLLSAELPSTPSQGHSPVGTAGATPTGVLSAVCA